MVSFGYVAGDGTGTNSIFGSGQFLTRYVNDTGGWVWVDTVEILNVHTAISGATLQVAVYSDVVPFAPCWLEALSATFTSLTTGTNTIALTSDVPVAPGGGIWIALRSTASLQFDGASASTPRVLKGEYSGGSSFEDPFGWASRRTTILPARAIGATTTDASATVARVAHVIVEPITQGLSLVRGSHVIAEPLSEGVSVIRLATMWAEVLQQLPSEGEMATDVFPIGLGLSWTVRKRPIFATQVRTATSLREVRNALATFPVWEFEVSFVFLLDDDDQPNITLGTTDMKYVEGFWLKQRGAFKSWLFSCPGDNVATLQPMMRQTDLGAGGDGVTVDFYFARTVGGWSEPVGQVDTVAGYTVKVDGATVAPADFTFVAPNKIIFDVAPAAGKTVTATFDYYYVCRFSEDAADFEQFAGNLWQLQEVGFRSIIQ
jgi:hypothetical protein